MKIKSTFCILLSMVLIGVFAAEFGMTACAVEMKLETPSVILIEAGTGQTIYEKNADEKRSPASVTKIMTLLLALEAVKEEKISLSDEVRTSAHAKSMGGSQVFLEEGEVQTVDTLLKCIAVASGNDAAVCIAEHVAGSEEEFVYRMNRKAAELGMNNTNFVDCCGLTDSDEHYTTARDIALMSRELITKYPEVSKYTTIWMENITHVTNRGTEIFTLANTNKLIKSYQWCNGLKTGFTQKAMYCLSATASKEGMDMVAVLLGAPDSKVRFAEAINLLNYGFAVSHIYIDENREAPSDLVIKGALEDMLPLKYEGEFRYLDTKGQNPEQVEKMISLPEYVEAPIKEGQPVGEAIYLLNGRKIGSVPILSEKTMEKAEYVDFLRKTIQKYILFRFWTDASGK